MEDDFLKILEKIDNEMVELAKGIWPDFESAGAKYEKYTQLSHKRFRLLKERYGQVIAGGYIKSTRGEDWEVKEDIAILMQDSGFENVMDAKCKPSTIDNKKPLKFGERVEKRFTDVRAAIRRRGDA